MAIRRTTPALLGLFSLIALLGDRHMTRAVDIVRQAAWYHKRDPTFSDALALVRKESWAHATFCGSPSGTDTIKVPKAFVERLTDADCYAASMAKVELEGVFCELRPNRVLRTSLGFIPDSSSCPMLPHDRAASLPDRSEAFTGP
jgi:hypothetical protein